MTSKRILLGLCGGAMLLAATALSQTGASDKPKQDQTDNSEQNESKQNGSKSNPQEAATENGSGGSITDALGGPDRFLTHISTDKPFYRPGETVYVRGVLLHSQTRVPLAANAQPGYAAIEIRGPKGDVVAGGSSQLADSVVGFAWAVPAEQAGGEYSVRISHPATGYAPAERKFDVRVYRAPRLKNQIVFIRDGYGPGDTVSATLRSERAEGGIPSGAKVTIQARIDGVPVNETTTTIDPNGIATARFDLPKTIARGEGTLAFVIEDGGVVETASKTIPILLQTIDLTLYPEGGELVAGLPNRVYISARTPAQKPADLKGIIVDSRGTEVASLSTEHEGRGRTSFTPKSNEKYALKIVEPAGIRTTYPLPAVRNAGAVLTSTADVVPNGRPVELRVGSPSAGKLTIVLSQREKEIARQEVSVKAGVLSDVLLNPKEADGVLVATVWSADKQPLAERLIFRQPRETVNVSVTADRTSYTPGSPAKLSVKTTDAAGKPVPAVVGITVTDDSVLEMVEKREQSPRLPVMALLEADVKDLADAHVYLDPKNEKAPRAVDLLLATQGWRRFAFVDLPKFLSEQGDSARRVVAIRVVTEVESRRTRGLDPRSGRIALFRNGAVDADDFANEKSDANGPIQRGKSGNDKSQPVSRSSVLGAAPREVREKLQEESVKQLKDAVAAGAKREIDGRRFLSAGGLAAAKRPAGNFDAFEEISWVVVREFAHRVRPDRKPGDRVDFAETLYWNAGLKTNEAGEAEVAFAMNDSVTSFRIFADAFSGTGGLGSGSIAVESVEPFYVEPKLPLEVTSQDVIRLPLGLVNRTSENLPSTTLAVEAAGLQVAGIDSFAMPPDSRKRHLLTLNVGEFSGKTNLVLKASAGPYADKVTRPLVVKPLGFPFEIGKGGMLAANETKTHEIQIPDQIVPGSLTAHVAVYPTPLASMSAAMEALIQQPYGCFEQTSSTTYPLVMAQQYFTTHTGIDPAVIQKAGDTLDAGYKRLLGFECRSGGFEWFGEDPGHEALSAYGLLEFTDMSAVRAVDTAMIERTRAWLLTRRDGNGGYKRERRTLHTWIEDRDCSNAYITWSLLRGGAKDLSAEVASVKAAAEKSSNSYVVALAANVLHQAGDRPGRNALLDRLVQLQEPNGGIKGATTSIVGSGGDALVIETTALATLAWLTEPDYIDFADKGVKYLAEVCKAGRYGSTQSTVLAIQAIVENDKALARPKSAGSVQLVVDGKPVGEPVKFDQNTQGAIALPDMASLLKPGKHTVAVKMDGGSSMPHTVSVKLHTAKPDSSADCAVRIETALRDGTIAEGAVTEIQVKVSNAKDEAVPTPIALIGIPGGLEVRHDQLKELVKSKKIAAYEVIGRDVVLYWRDLAAKQSVELPVSVVAAVPGEYAGPASRAYLYYTDELKQWSNPLKVTITPRAE